MPEICARCGKSFTGENAKVTVQPSSHGWAGPNGKMIYCADATEAQLAAYKRAREIAAARVRELRGGA